MQASAEAHPNIALIKYWGKSDRAQNLPAVGSLSLTLDTLVTRMDVAFAAGESADRLVVNGRPDDKLLPRVSNALDRIAGQARDRALITSESNFPIAAGLASSASAFAALTVAGAAAAGRDADRLGLARIAGSISGSAARSLYAGIVELSVGDGEIDLEPLAGLEDWPLAVVVAVTAGGVKPVSSGDAMLRSAATSPFFSRWVDEQPGDLAEARAAVLDRDFERLAAVSEHNCLKMHSLMWTSRPPIVYWNHVTLACMQAIRDLRSKGIPVFFTIDAGPQVKAICLPESVDSVRQALAEVEGVQDIMTTGLGEGAKLVSRP